MGVDQQIPTINLVNEVNPPSNRCNNRLRPVPSQKNCLSTEKYNSSYNQNQNQNQNNISERKKIFRRTLHYTKKPNKLFEIEQQKDNNNKDENNNENINRKTIKITKEQRNLLQSLCQKNVIENKKPVAKNLVKLISKRKSFLRKNESLKSNNNNSSLKKKISAKRIIKTGKNATTRARTQKKLMQKSLINSLDPKKNNTESKFAKRYSVGNLTKIPPFQKNENNISSCANVTGGSELLKDSAKNVAGSTKNKNKNNPTRARTNTLVRKIKKSKDKKNSPIKRNSVDYSVTKKIDFNSKKNLVFQRKSFRNYFDNINNKTYNYYECLNFINSTQVLSHLNEFQKYILSESLKLENFHENTFIVKANKKASTIYFIKKGRCRCLDEEKCIRILKEGDNFGERAILVNSLRTMDIETITNCVCYSINVKTLKRMFGDNFISYLYLNFLKGAFYSSKIFRHVSNYLVEKIFRFFEAVNLGSDNVAFPIGHVKSSKMIVLVSGDLVNSKTGEIVGKSGDILFEDELLSLNDSKINYALNPSPDALFLEADTNKILNFLNCRNFTEIFDKVGICNNLSQINLFKSLSKEKLTKLVEFIQIEKYKNKDIIIREGTIGNKFYIVKSGNVEIYSKDKYLRTLNETEYFGERSLLTNEMRSATVIAKGIVELYSLDKKNFLSNLSRLMNDYLHKSLYLHDETVSLDDLVFIKNLGSGTYGSVSLVMNKKTKFPYAIKAINKDHIKYEDLMKNIQLEKQILLKIDNPFIEKLVKCLKDENNIYFLLEYIRGSELFDVIREIGLLNKPQTNFYIASMFIAINYLHERKIIYRDIKPENILVTSNGYLKFVDFGTAKEINERTSTIIGTPHYMAPEIILGKGYSFQVDYWSIAICMYEFICGGVPFGESLDDPLDIYFAVLNQKLSFPNYCINDINFRLLMKEMLEKNPSCRLTSFESIKAHNWFKNFNWDELSNLNLEAPYKPLLLYSKYEFNERSEPNFSITNSQFKSYKDYIKENNNVYKSSKKNMELTKEKCEEYNTWIDNF